MCEKRLWARIDLNGPVPAHASHLGPCHLWLGALNEHGYGVVRWNGRMERVHRVIWELTHGPIPLGRKLLHECDNRSCVRHLRLGTQAENMADMKQKGRSARGERNGAAVLTEPVVKEIRERVWSLAGSRLNDREPARLGTRLNPSRANGVMLRIESVRAN